MEAINRSNSVMEFDIEGKIRFANEPFLKLIGYSLDEIRGKHHKMLVPADISSTEEYAACWGALAAGNFISDVYRLAAKDGHDVWLQATFNPIVDSEGKVTSILQIAVDITERMEQSAEIVRKNTYLEQAARILRHDMHSGINVYIPRGISSLIKRIPPELITEHSLDAPLRMLSEGLVHTQKVYRGVFEFTNLVKSGTKLATTECDLKESLKSFLSSTNYKSQVEIMDCGKGFISEILFCTAVDNLIRNGLRYNDSPTKLVRIYRKPGDVLVIEDNGRGMTQEEFVRFSSSSSRREGQKESGSGLGLGICVAILREHGFTVTCEKAGESGTVISIGMAE